jgi:exosortase
MTVFMDIDTSVADSSPRALPKDPPQGFLGPVQVSSIIGIALICAVIIAGNFSTLVHLVGRWSREPDYTYGFLVPFCSGWLLWQRRGLIRCIGGPVRGRWLGVALLILSALLRLFAIYADFVLLEAVALIVCVAGVPVLIGGFSALRWAWPAIVFLFFMIPLPGVVAGRLSGPLQRIATVSSTYVLETLGVAAIASGNVIWLTQGTIGVVEACNGLRMLMMFGAVTTAVAFFIKPEKWEAICLLVSAPGIAIAANIFRITATGVALELVGPQLSDKIFHDLAGWIMMPLAMLMLGLEVLLLSKLFPKIPERPLVVARPLGRAKSPTRSR